MIGSYNSACPPVVGVQDLTSNTIAVNRGSSYRIRHYAGFCDNATTTISGDGWIDWNHNLIFEPSEKVWSYDTENSATYSATVMVPFDAALGTTRLRIQVRQGEFPAISACDVFRYGGTKDVSIAISPVPTPAPTTTAKPLKTTAAPTVPPTTIPPTTTAKPAKTAAPPTTIPPTTTSAAKPTKSITVH